MTNGYQGRPPKRHAVDETTVEKSASAATLEFRLQELQEQQARIEELLAKKRGDTGVQQVLNEVRRILSNADADEETARAGRRTLLRNIGLIVGGLMSVFGGGGGVYYAYVREPPPPPVEPEDVQKTVKDRTDQLEKVAGENSEAIKGNKHNLRTLGREFIRADDEQIERDQYIFDMLHAISPRAKKVTAPPSVKAREEKKEEEELDQRVDTLFGPASR